MTHSGYSKDVKDKGKQLIEQALGEIAKRGNLNKKTTMEMRFHPYPEWTQHI